MGFCTSTFVPLKKATKQQIYKPMKLAEQIEIYKSKHPNREHTFRNGVKCPKLHDWLDMMYRDSVKEFKTHGTKNTAEYVKEMLK